MVKEVFAPRSRKDALNKARRVASQCGKEFNSLRKPLKFPDGLDFALERYASVSIHAGK